MTHAVFKDDKRVSKYYDNRLAALIDVYEQGLVVNNGRFGKSLAKGVEIKQIRGPLYGNNAAEYAQQYEKSNIYFWIAYAPIIIIALIILTAIVALDWKFSLFIGSIIAVIFWFFYWCDKADDLQRRGK